MAISEPKKPWAIVFQRLDGTAPPDSIVNDLRLLFQAGSFGGTSLADYWSGQTLGTVDITGSKVFGWQDSGWTIQTHPGQNAGQDRGALAQKARGLVPNMGDFRGVIAVYNYPCSGGNANADVVWGLNGYGSTPAWADDGWRRCDRCHRIVDANAGTSPCAAGGSHSLNARRYCTVTANDVPKTRSLDRCANCGALYASDLMTAAGVAECPGGPAHKASGQQATVLAGWPDPPAEREFSLCSLCRCVAPDGDTQPCPGSADGHQPVAKAAIHFPLVDIDERGLGGRGFLAHEMGHAYGFDHGRGISPRSHDLGDDCWPGAYGDPYDIMSYAACQSYTPGLGDPDGGLGRAGPGLGIQHLLGAGLIPDNAIETVDLNAIAAGGGADVTLRPVTGGGPGKVAVWADRYVFEYRRRAGWDRELNTKAIPGGNEPGMVVARHVSLDDREIPQLVPSMHAVDYLSSGDTFEARPGLGNMAASVQIASDGSSAHLSFYALPGVGTDRHSQRWLLIPYRASDSAATFDHGRLAGIAGAVDSYWQDLAEDAFSVAGSYLLSTDKDPSGNGGVTVGATMAQLAAMSPQDRVRAVVDAGLSVPNPSDPGRVMPMDWRWFTGIVLLDGDGKGTGYLGSVRLDSGVLPAERACPTADHPRRLDQLDYEVIELPAAALSHAALARETGRSLGFGARTDPYDLMADDGVALRYTAPAAGSPFGDASWGPMGPAVSTADLKDRGWLPDWQVQTVQVQGGGPSPRPTIGSVVLKPVVHEGGRRNGVVRLEVGPYALEFRSPSSWDRGIPSATVLASQDGADPVTLGQGEEVTWGGPIPELTGGGRVQVTALSDTEALVSYYAVGRPLIEAGGGTLRGGGTLLFRPDGSVIHIPPGDPLEKNARKLVGDDIGALIEKVGKLKGL